jgi:methyl-accepting chemotaxis protein
VKSLSLAQKLALALCLPLIAVAFFGIRSAWEKWSIYRDYVRLEQNSAVLQQIGQSVHELQKERGRSAGFLGSQGKQFAAELAEQRRSTDQVLERLRSLLAQFDAKKFGPDFERQFARGLADLAQLPSTRGAISDLKCSTAESTATYTSAIAHLLDVVVAMSHLSNDAIINNGISCYVNFLQAKEQAGIERATLTGVFAANAFSGEAFRRFNTVQAAQVTYLRVFESFASESQKQFVATTLRGEAVQAVERLREIATAKSATGNFGVSAADWFAAATARIDLMKQVEDRLAADYARAADGIKADARRHFALLAVTTGLVLALTIVVTGWVARSLTRGLLRIASQLAEGATEVSSAAAQVSKASQTTAAGASEQAAALEETAASLEEVSSMCQRNLASANETQNLARLTRTSADAGAQEMTAMQAAIDAIHGSANNIARILKSIDEIAFQTNILALNAAVEAARAGEAGAGFAIVAEEVRALAQRSAAAAKDTAEKVGASVHDSEHGVEISQRVARHFSEIVERTHRVDTLVTEIVTGSTEQTAGIRQVSDATTQMDHTTQASAATAEETAAQAEELNAQAEALQAVAKDLLHLVNGEAAATQKSSSVPSWNEPVRSRPRTATAPTRLAAGTRSSG